MYKALYSHHARQFVGTNGDIVCTNQCMISSYHGATLKMRKAPHWLQTTIFIQQFDNWFLFISKIRAHLCLLLNPFLCRSKPKERRIELGSVTVKTLETTSFKLRLNHMHEVYFSNSKEKMRV